MRWKLPRTVSDRGKVIEGCTVTPDYTPDNEVRFSLIAGICLNTSCFVPLSALRSPVRPARDQNESVSRETRRQPDGKQHADECRLGNANELWRGSPRTKY